MVLEYVGYLGGVPGICSIIQGGSLMKFQVLAHISIECGQVVAVVYYCILCPFEGEQWGSQLFGCCPNELFCRFP